STGVTPWFLLLISTVAPGGSDVIFKVSLLPAASIDREWINKQKMATLTNFAIFIMSPNSTLQVPIYSNCAYLSKSTPVTFGHFQLLYPFLVTDIGLYTHT